MRSLFAGCAFLVATLAGPLAFAGAAEKPNILFLFADDHRPDAIGAYGNHHVRTPHIDRLVERGTSFVRNYCMGSIHGAVCQPSRAMLMSGRTLYRVKMDLSGVVQLPEVLRKNGYATFGTGKWHNGKASFLRAFENGKAVFLGGMSDHTKVPIVEVKDGQATPRRFGESFSSELFADAAVEFLKQHDGSKPFFAYVSFTAPHDPRQPPREFVDEYYKNLPPLPANFLPQHPFHNGWMTGRDEALAGWPRTEAVIRDQLAEYYGMITHMDAHIGRVLDVVKKRGFDDNTIVVFAADHGLAVGSHGLLGKQNLYEHSMGCPLVFAGPGIPAGKRTKAFSYLYDIFPTLCDAAGVAIPDGVEGKSLRGIWSGNVEGVRESVFTTYEDKMRAVRDDRWKLIRYPRIGHTQLFDLQSDPHEMHDLARDPDQARRVESMLALLRRWQQETGDKQPLIHTELRPMEYDFSKRKRKPDVHQPKWIRDKYFGATPKSP